MTKYCTKCNAKHIKTGHQTWCPNCRSMYAKIKHKQTYIRKPLISVSKCIKCGTLRNTQSRWVGKYCRNCYESVYRQNNVDIKEKTRQRNKIYRQNNKDKRCIYENKRLKTNPSARLANRFRNWINKLITRKNGNAATLIGCSYDELKSYLESKFKSGMTWDNWGIHGWHIDHRKPLASFDLTDPKQQLIAFHYTNLQPLWAEDNLKKGSKYENL